MTARPAVTPQLLRVQDAAKILDVDADFFGTSYETIVRTYGHHHPSWQEATADIMDRRAK